MVDTVYRNSLVPDRGSIYDVAQLNPNVIYDVRDDGSALNNMVSTLDKWLQEGHKKLDRETIKKAQLAGSTAGLFLDYKDLEGDTLAAETFNKAGGETFLNTKLTQVSSYMHKMTIDPSLRNDPLRMEHVLTDGRKEYLKDVPLRMIPEFVTAYNDRMGRALQSAQTNQVNLAISANAAKFLEMETTLLAEVTNAARSGDERAVNQARTEYFSRINAQVGLSMTPEEATRKKLSLQRQIQIDATIGDSLRVPLAERAAFMEKFVKDNPLGTILQASEVDDLKRQMLSSWDAHDKLKDNANAGLAAKQKKTVDMNKANFHLAPTTENYMKLVTTPGIDPEDIASARRYLNTFTDNPDPVLVNDLEGMIYQGKIAEVNNILNDPKTAPRIGQQPMIKLREMIVDQQSGGGFEKTEAYQEVIRRIDEDYGSMSGLKMAGKAVRQQIYDELRTAWPKYKAGEIQFSEVDPIRLYQLKRSANLKTDGAPSPGKTLTTRDGPVVIPNIYIEDPDQFFKDKKVSMDKRLKDNKEVIDYMNKLRVEKEKQAKTKGAQ